MGQQAKTRAARGGDVHWRRFKDGTISAWELWRQTVLGRGKCGKCGGPPVLQIFVFLPMDDYLRDMPVVAMRRAAEHGGQHPYVMMRGPGGEPRKFARALHAYACAHCQKEIELWAAKAPSYAVVEIDRGPPKERRTVQVA